MSDGTAASFLKQIALAATRGRAVHPFTDNADGFAAAVEAQPDALEAWLVSLEAQGWGSVAEVRASAFASAAVRSDGTMLESDPRIDVWDLDPDKLARLARAAKRKGGAEVGIIDDASGRPVAVAITPSVEDGAWPLRPEVKAALSTAPDALALIAFSPQERDWLIATRAYGLTPAQTRLLSALSKVGDLREACAGLGIAYDTGRKLVAAAMNRTGAARQPELIRQTLSITAGALRPTEAVDRMLADLFTLRPRQAKLARCIARGLTREQAAMACNISQAVAKDDLKEVYAAAGVSGAVELARVIAEVEALHGLASASDVVLHRGLASPDPVRFVPRKSRHGQIAVADHGPTHAPCALVFHTSTGGRAQSPRTLAALRAAGWRAVVIERPGYGLTDPAGPDPWQGAALDVADVMDALSIPKAAILARGGARPALTTAYVLADRIVGGVLVGPDPPAHLDTSLSGMTGATKAWMFRNPGVIRSLAAFLSQNTGAGSVARMMTQSVKNCPPDQALIALPGELDALVRGGRQSAMGMTGFAAEMEAWVTGRAVSPVMPGQRWTIAWGADDQLFNASASLDWWLTAVPGATPLTIPAAGRWVAASHADQIVACLPPVVQN